MRSGAKFLPIRVIITKRRVINVDLSNMPKFSENAERSAQKPGYPIVIDQDVNVQLILKISNTEMRYDNILWFGKTLLKKL
jgi:hypothetical protein